MTRCSVKYLLCCILPPQGHLSTGRALHSSWFLPISCLAPLLVSEKSYYTRPETTVLVKACFISGGFLLFPNPSQADVTNDMLIGPLLSLLDSGIWWAKGIHAARLPVKPLSTGSLSHFSDRQLCTRVKTHFWKN